MKELYLEDFELGQIFTSKPELLTEAALTEFAAQFDPQPFHLDHAAAEQSIFQGMAASGWHTAALTMRMMVNSELKPAGGLVGAGIDGIRWARPVRPGDELSIRIEAIEIRRSKSRPTQGIVKIKVDTFNQNGEEVQQLFANLVVLARTSVEAGVE